MNIIGMNAIVVLILVISSWILLWASGYHKFADIKWIYGDKSLGYELAEGFMFSAFILAVIAALVVGIKVYV